MINTKYADPKEDHPDVQLIFGGYLADCAETGMVGEKKGTNRSIYVIPTILHPKSRGYLRLRNNDPLSKPLIYPKYLTHPDDAAALVEAVKFGIRLSETQALKRYELSISHQFLWMKVKNERRCYIIFKKEEFRMEDSKYVSCPCYYFHIFCSLLLKSI